MPSEKMNNDMTDCYEKTKPLVRWAGSKARIINELGQSIPKFSGRYIELFAGSACLLHANNFSDALISDINFDLINFYRSLKNNSKRIYKEYQQIPRDSFSYYKVRELLKSERNAIKRSTYFYYLNRNCFNGLYRTNKKGHFNVPFSSAKIASYLSEDQFFSSASKINHTRTECQDYTNVISENVSSGDFIYLDPPYYIPNVRVFQEYGATHFGIEDFGVLKECLLKIDKLGAHFLLSYPKCELSIVLASEWKSREIRALRSISASTSSRGYQAELLITNY